MGNKPPVKFYTFCNLPEDAEEIYYHVCIHFDTLLKSTHIQPTEFWIGPKKMFYNLTELKTKNILPVHDWTPNTCVRETETLQFEQKLTITPQQAVGVIIVPGHKVYVKFYLEADTACAKQAQFGSYKNDKELFQLLGHDLRMGYEILILEHHRSRTLFEPTKLQNSEPTQFTKLAEKNNPKRRRAESDSGDDKEESETSQEELEKEVDNKDTESETSEDEAFDTSDDIEECSVKITKIK